MTGNQSIRLSEQKNDMLHDFDTDDIALWAKTLTGLSPADEIGGLVAFLSGTCPKQDYIPMTFTEDPLQVLYWEVHRHENWISRMLRAWSEKPMVVLYQISCARHILSKKIRFIIDNLLWLLRVLPNRVRCLNQSGVLNMCQKGSKRPTSSFQHFSLLLWLHWHLP